MPKFPAKLLNKLLIFIFLSNNFNENIKDLFFFTLGNLFLPFYF